MDRQNNRRVPTQIHTRELDRAVAKVNMKKGGLRRTCKGGFFSENWRKFADPVAYKKQREAEKKAAEEANKVETAETPPTDNN